MAGQATPTLCAWSLAAARTHARRYRPVFVRPPHQLGMRVRRSHLRAGVDRFVQPAYWYARILSAAWPYIILRHSVFECDPIRSQRCTTALTQTHKLEIESPSGEAVHVPSSSLRCQRCASGLAIRMGVPFSQAATASAVSE